MRPAAIALQLHTLRHRGPDAEGAFECPHAWVGQTRLAVIDLETGNPPVTNERRTVGAVLNGEVYNYRQLRAALRREGHAFSTEGDTEVLVHLAEELEPIALVSSLEGMFAFAVWDDPRQRLVLARDRFGKKPLYYWTDGARLVFASEIKALLAHPNVSRRLHPAAIPQYLTFGYVPAPDTFFEGIRSVPAAHVLVAEPGGEPRVERYWAPCYPGCSEVARLDLPFKEAKTRVRDLLRAAVERRLVSDVPLGAFLSGGLDSCAVVALMAEATHGPVSTFTIGFDKVGGFDERPYARAVAARYHTDHTEFVVKPSAVDLIERLVWHHDQPFGDSSALPTFILSELTKHHVKVALSGDGGDELFAGYQRFAAALAVARYERLPQPVRSRMRTAGERLTALRFTDRWPKVSRFVASSDRSAPMTLQDWVSFVPQHWRTRLAPTWEWDGRWSYRQIWERSAGAHALDRILDLNVQTYLLDDLLPKVDRMSMAHGLEVRSPFLDRELAEFAFRLPPGAHLRGLSLKRVLKCAVADLVPTEIVRRPKHGFSVPLDRWFRSTLSSYVSGMLCSRESRVGDALSSAGVQAMVSEHQAGRANHGHALWTLLTLEIFLRREAW